MVEAIDDMFLTYSLMKRRFEKHPENVFNLPTFQKVLSNIKEEVDENGERVFKYQDIKLQYFEREKESIQRNTTKYIDLILDALTERFAALSDEQDEQEDVSGTPLAGDAILHDICLVIDSRKSILPENTSPTIKNVTYAL